MKTLLFPNKVTVEATGGRTQSNSQQECHIIITWSKNLFNLSSTLFLQEPLSSCPMAMTSVQSCGHFGHYSNLSFNAFTWWLYFLPRVLQNTAKPILLIGTPDNAAFLLKPEQTRKNTMSLRCLQGRVQLSTLLSDIRAFEWFGPNKKWTYLFSPHSSSTWRGQGRSGCVAVINNPFACQWIQSNK